MSKSIKIVLGIITLVIIVSAGYFSFNANDTKRQTKEEIIKIGAILPLTGGVSIAGEAARDSIILAMEEVNANPANKHKYNVIFEDAPDAKTAVSAAKKLIDTDNVDAFITDTTSLSEAVAPLVKEKGIPHFAITAKLELADGKFNFVHFTPPASMVRKYFSKLTQEGYKNLSVLSLNNSGWDAILDEVKKQSSENGVQLLDINKFNPGEKDFRTIIAKTKKNNPEAYLIMSFPPELEQITTQIKELGITMPLTYISGLDVAKDKTVFEGYWCSCSGAPSEILAKKFEARFARKIGPTGANAYDSLKLIVLGFEMTKGSKKPLGSNVSEQILKIKNFQGSLGSLTVDQKGIVDSEATIKTIINGQVVNLSK